MRLLCATATALLLATGSTAALAAAESSDRTLVTPSIAVEGGHRGAEVLWGGRIFARKADTGDECLEVAALPLGAPDGRPARASPSDGQHFIACGPPGFVSATHAVRSLVTVAGTVRDVEQRFVRRPRGYVVYENGRKDAGSARQPMEHGCELRIPIVDVADSRSWSEEPSRPSGPTP